MLNSSVQVMQGCCCSAGMKERDAFVIIAYSGVCIWPVLPFDQAQQKRPPLALLSAAIRSTDSHLLFFPKFVEVVLSVEQQNYYNHDILNGRLQFWNSTEQSPKYFSFLQKKTPPWKTKEPDQQRCCNSATSTYFCCTLVANVCRFPPGEI